MKISNEQLVDFYIDQFEGTLINGQSFLRLLYYMIESRYQKDDFMKVWYILNNVNQSDFSDKKQELPVDAIRNIREYINEYYSSYSDNSNTIFLNWFIDIVRCELFEEFEECDEKLKNLEEEVRKCTAIEEIIEYADAFLRTFDNDNFSDNGFKETVILKFIEEQLVNTYNEIESIVDERYLSKGIKYVEQYVPAEVFGGYEYNLYSDMPLEYQPSHLRKKIISDKLKKSDYDKVVYFAIIYIIIKVTYLKNLSLSGNISIETGNFYDSIINEKNEFFADLNKEM